MLGQPLTRLASKESTYPLDLLCDQEAQFLFPSMQCLTDNTPEHLLGLGKALVVPGLFGLSSQTMIARKAAGCDHRRRLRAGKGSVMTKKPCFVF